MEWLCMIFLLAYCLYLGFRSNKNEERIKELLKRVEDDGEIFINIYSKSGLLLTCQSVNVNTIVEALVDRLGFKLVHRGCDEEYYFKEGK